MVDLGLVRLKVGTVDIIKIFQFFSEVSAGHQTTLYYYYLSQKYHLNTFQAILLDFRF